MKVRDFMIHDVKTLKPSNTVKELLMVLVTNKIGGAPVTDDVGKLVGFISDGDVLRFLAPKPKNLFGLYHLVYLDEDAKIEDNLEENLQTPISEMMESKNIVAVTPETALEKTARILSQNKYKTLPVVNGAGRVVGILSRGDLLYHISKKIIHV